MKWLIGILTAALIFFSAAMINAAVERDGGGTLQIDTFHNYDNYPHMLLIKTYAPNFDGDPNGDPKLSGEVDTMMCAENIRMCKIKADAKADELITNIREALGDDYIITVAVSVCHPEWFVIYLHDGTKFVDDESIYAEAWNAIIKGV